MARDTVAEWSTTPADNVTVGPVNIGNYPGANAMVPPDVNNALREMMSQIKVADSDVGAKPFEPTLSAPYVTGRTLRNALDDQVARASAFGFVGGVDETSRLTSVLADIQTAGLRKLVFPYVPDAYYFRQAQISDMDIVVEGKTKIRLFGADNTRALRLVKNVNWQGGVFDGQLSVSNLVELGSPSDADASDIRLSGFNVINCPTNSFRTSTYGSVIQLFDFYATGSKIFNTVDAWQGQDVIVSNFTSLDIPGEGFLFDQPAYTASRSGVIVSNGTMKGRTSDSTYTDGRCISFARTAQWLLSNMILEGCPKFADVIHFEDKSFGGRIQNSILIGNGVVEAIIDGALDGDITYPQADRQPKEVVIQGNTFYSAGVKTFNIEGTAPLVFERIDIKGNTIYDPASLGTIIANTGSFADNDIYGAVDVLRVRSVDGGSGAFTDDCNFVRTGNRYHRKMFVYADQGYSYDPNNVVYHTRFSGGDASITGRHALTGTAVGTTGAYALTGTSSQWYRVLCPGQRIEIDSRTYNIESVTSDTAMTVTTALLTSPAGATVYSSSIRQSWFGGSQGTGGVISYPTENSLPFLRATIGSTAMSREIRVALSVDEFDIRDGDCISLAVMTRSSAQIRGRMQIVVSGATTAELDLNAGSNFASWKQERLIKSISPASSDLSATGAGFIQVKIFLGQGGVAGDTFDLGEIEISVCRPEA